MNTGLIDNISFVITSHNRLDLLERTINSIPKVVRDSIETKIIIDDSGCADAHRKISDKYGDEYLCLLTDAKCHPKSVDLAYSRIHTDYVFHCEDDWIFDVCDDFILNALDILEYDANAFQVTFRQDEVHPLVDETKNTDNGTVYKQRVFGWRNQWYGFTYNPSVLRLDDYFSVMPYFPRQEHEIAKSYYELPIIGSTRSSVALLGCGGVRHIGRRRHTFPEIIRPVANPSKVKCIIICAGDAKRWGNHLGVPKHLITLEGEVILERLVKQLSRCDDNEIHVVVKEDDERYRVPGSSLYIADLNPDNVDADKFLSSQQLWSRKGRTVVFYGDVWFSDTAIEAIINYKKEDWVLFGRSTRSKITGCAWGECFAQSFYPEGIEEHKANLFKIANAYKNKEIKRCGGWEHYRAMVGLPLKEHKITKRFYTIDDWTDDFDTPKDYERWVKNRKAKEKHKC